jgi:hypothetical protein
MDRSVLIQALYRLRWQTAWLGTPGKTGFGLLVFSAVFFIAAVLPRHVETSALMHKAQEVKVNPQEKITVAAGRKIQGDQGLQAFYAFFPNIDSSPFWIREMVQAAATSDVEISGSDYRMVRDKGWRLARYEMMLPVRGRYSQVRAFIAAALHIVPPMALVEVVIKREGVESELLETNLKFNLYLNEGRK